MRPESFFDLRCLLHYLLPSFRKRSGVSLPTCTTGKVNSRQIVPSKHRARLGTVHALYLRKRSTKTIIGWHARIEAYFTLPQNTIAYLLKDPIAMRYSMFRLQGVIAQLMQRPMPRGAFHFFINKGHSLLMGV